MFPKATITKYHHPGGLKQQKLICSIYSSYLSQSVLDTGSLKSRFWQGHALSEDSGGEFVHAFVLACGDCQQALASLVCTYIISISAFPCHVMFSLYLCFLF